MKYKFLLFIAALVLSGCKEELYRDLTQSDANQMMVILTNSHIDSEKVVTKDGSFVLSVNKANFIDAVDILHMHGYPRRDYQSVNDIFPSGQLVTSPAQELVKINYLKEQSLEKMLSDIDGVITARVSVALGVNSDSGDATPGSASVFIKYSPDVNLDGFITQIKSLVHNSVPELTYESISVVLQPAQYLLHKKESPAETSAEVQPYIEKRTIYMLLGGLWVICLLFITVSIYRKRRSLVKPVSLSTE